MNAAAQRESGDGGGNSTSWYSRAHSRMKRTRSGRIALWIIALAGVALVAMLALAPR